MQLCSAHTQAAARPLISVKLNAPTVKSILTKLQSILPALHPKPHAET